MPRHTHKPRAHRCSKCGRRFDSGTALATHRRNVHAIGVGREARASKDGFDLPEFDIEPKKLSRFDAPTRNNTTTNTTGRPDRG